MEAIFRPQGQAKKTTTTLPYCNYLIVETTNHPRVTLTFCNQNTTTSPNSEMILHGKRAREQYPLANSGARSGRLPEGGSDHTVGSQHWT